MVMGMDVHCTVSRRAGVQNEQRKVGLWLVDNCKFEILLVRKVCSEAFWLVSYILHPGVYHVDAFKIHPLGAARNTWHVQWAPQGD